MLTARNGHSPAKPVVTTSAVRGDLKEAAGQVKGIVTIVDCDVIKRDQWRALCQVGAAGGAESHGGGGCVLRNTTNQNQVKIGIKDSVLRVLHILGINSMTTEHTLAKN